MVPPLTVGLDRGTAASLLPWLIVAACSGAPAGPVDRDASSDDAGVEAGAVDCRAVRDIGEWRHCFDLQACRDGVACDGYWRWLSETVLGEDPERYVGLQCRLGPVRDDRFWEGVAAGRIAIDLEAASRCFTWEGERCVIEDPADFPYPREVREDCERMLDGAVPIGGACRHPWECAGASALAAMCDLSSTCPGLCVALGDVGEPCDPSEQSCRWPLVCGADGVCLAGAPGDACRSPLDCRDRNCVLDATGAGVCTNRLGMGEPCERPTDCAPALYCVDARCEPAAPLAAECGARPCLAGLRCIDARCVAIALPGEPCDDRDRVCPRGLACLDAVCAPLPILGEPCDDRRACIEGACTRGTCALLSAGEPCDLSSPLGQCEGRCTDSTTSGPICRAPAPLGARCDAWPDCARDFFCLDGACAECGTL